MKYPWKIQGPVPTGNGTGVQRAQDRVGALMRRERLYDLGADRVTITNVETGEQIPEPPACRGAGCESRSYGSLLAMGHDVCRDHWHSVTYHELRANELLTAKEVADHRARYERACAEVDICTVYLCWLRRTVGERCGVHAQEA